MSKLTAAYIAGFVDGEGYIGLIRNKGRQMFRRIDYYVAVLKVGNTNKDIIYWLKNSFGGTIWIRNPKDNQNKKIAYLWTLDNKNLIPFLDKIYPYLRIKRKQVEIVRKLKDTINRKSYSFPERIARNGGRFISKTLNNDVADYREKLYKEIRILNKRGNPLHCERLNKETSLNNEDAIVRTLREKQP